MRGAQRRLFATNKKPGNEISWDFLTYKLLKGHSFPSWEGALDASADDGSVVDNVNAVATKTTNKTGINNLRIIHLSVAFSKIL